MTSNEKFWAYSSGKAEINVAKLYEYLNKKGYRYYQTSIKDPIYIILVRNNNVEVLFDNVCSICLSIFDEDFSSLSEDERIEVKSRLKALEHSLTRKQLAHFKPEDLKSIEESGSKYFLTTLNKKYYGEKGGTL
jgi:hypothetical protein